jgi:hypothetical protein
MKIKEKKKKLLLVFLLVVMGLILFSGYIKTTEIELSSIFGHKKISKQKELLFETEKEIKKEDMAQKQNINKNKNDLSANLKEKTKIETITLTKEIKDPFKIAKSVNNLPEEKDKNKIENKINETEELMFLEKNIAADLIYPTQNSEKITESEKKVPNELSLPVSENRNKEKIMKTDRQSLENIKLSFKLVGIIKNKTSSSALFLYQNQTLLKKENENIDVFKIEKINNNNLIISYQNEERIIDLWKEKYNEN